MIKELTAKQRDAVSMLARHLTTKEIARLLGIAPATVDQRIESAKRKLGAHNRRELARIYQDEVTLPRLSLWHRFRIGDIASIAARFKRRLIRSAS